MTTNKEFALKTAVELAKTNIESTDRWVDAEEVNSFINEIYSFLTGEKSNT